MPKKSEDPNRTNISASILNEVAKMLEELKITIKDSDNSTIIEFAIRELYADAPIFRQLSEEEFLAYKKRLHGKEPPTEKKSRKAS